MVRIMIGKKLISWCTLGTFTNFHNETLKYSVSNNLLKIITGSKINQTIPDVL